MSPDVEVNYSFSLLSPPLSLLCLGCILSSHFIWASRCPVLAFNLGSSRVRPLAAPHWPALISGEKWCTDGDGMKIKTTFSFFLFCSVLSALVHLNHLPPATRSFHRCRETVAWSTKDHVLHFSFEVIVLHVFPLKHATSLAVLKRSNWVLRRNRRCVGFSFVKKENELQAFPWDWKESKKCKTKNMIAVSTMPVFYAIQTALRMHQLLPGVCLPWLSRWTWILSHKNQLPVDIYIYFLPIKLGLNGKCL